MDKQAIMKPHRKTTHWQQLQPISNQSGISIQPAGKTVGIEWHKERIFDFDLWLILEGEITLFPECGGTYRLGRGGCVWLRPDAPFAFAASQKGRLRTAWIHFDFFDRKGRIVPCDRVKVPEMVREVRNIPFVEGVFRHLVALNSRVSERDEEKALLHQQSNHLLSVLLCEYELAAFAPSPSGVPPHYRQVVDAVRSWLEHHPDRLVSAGELAQKHGYSLPHFSRIFRKTTGQSPTQVILEMRIRQAQRLLLDSTLNISEVAANLGYDEVFYFSKQFKKVTGVPPLTFRQVNQAK